MPTSTRASISTTSRRSATRTSPHCPFGKPWGCGFSYHAVTTLDDAATIWDATLALDGDKDPTSAPSTELMVHGIPGADYLYRLSPDDTYFDNIDQGTLR